MAKSKFIMLRVDEDTKTALEEAASLRGVSLTTFILESAQHSARSVKPMISEKTAKSGACPVFFRACVCEAQQGGGLNYAHPGWHLANGLMNLGPYEMSDEEWRDCVSELLSFLKQDDFDAAWDWFVENLPKCADLIPARRRKTFLEGVWKAFEELRVF